MSRLFPNLLVTCFLICFQFYCEVLGCVVFEPFNVLGAGGGVKVVSGKVDWRNLSWWAVIASACKRSSGHGFIPESSLISNIPVARLEAPTGLCATNCLMSRTAALCLSKYNAFRFLCLRIAS